jgi:hypothetical protein
LNNGGEDCDDHEDGEDDILHACKRVVRLVEGEANEKTRDGAKNKLGHDIRGHSPVLLEDSRGDLAKLCTEGHGELGLAGGIVLGIL